MVKAMLVAVSVCLVACGDPAQFRQAKGVKDLPASKDAYRVQAPEIGCDELGFVIQATSIDDIAKTASNHGGTHFMVLDDFGGTTVETVGGATHIGGGNYLSHSSSQAVKHHAFTARVYRCQ